MTLIVFLYYVFLSISQHIFLFNNNKNNNNNNNNNNNDNILDVVIPSLT